MTPGTKVFFLWHDYISGRDLNLQGEVVDNELWKEHRVCAHLVNVRFMMPGVNAAVCHHFKPEELHLQQDTPQQTATADDVKRFLSDHWDAERNHLAVEHLNAFYQLWRRVRCSSETPANEAPVSVVAQPAALPSPTPKLETKPQQAPKRKKQSVQYIQLALFG